ncbi:MAG: leucine-rich repeat protein [Clostridia bacterium]|nr:leucine-rich repeat protein [Clostridia bacterium]
MKKSGNRLLALVLTLLLIMTVLPVSALAAPSDFTFTISDGGATITGYTGGGGYVSIPAQVESGGAYYPVVAIGDNAFQGNASISGLYIPAVTVGTYAFFQCSGLTSVTFETSVSQIRGYAFAQCPNLTNITFLHASSAFVGIEPYAFQLTGALTKTTVTVSSTANVNPYVKAYDWTGSRRTVEYGGLAPSITLQPVSKTCEEGSAVTFEVQANGYNPQYQWYYRVSPTSEWLKCTSAVSTNSTYTYSPTLDKSGYQYYVEVRNSYGAIASNVATLTVVKPTAAPVITRQPQNVTVNAGSKAIFEVEATGSGLQYQWYYKAPTSDWIEVDAAYGKNATYELPTDPDMHQNGFSYRCVVSNTGGSVTSNTVVLTVQTGIDAPVITKQPLSIIVDKGDSATFKVEATGTDLKFEWYYKTPVSDWYKCDAGAVTSTATTSTYTLADPTNMNGYQYHCIITNNAGTAVSNTVTLTVRTEATELKILTQPRSVVVSAGQNAVFSVLCQGIGVSYQWYSKAPTGTWKAVEGAVNSSYGFVADASLSGFQYKVVVANAQGSITSDVVTLAINGATGSAPVITVYPSELMVTIGKPATFRTDAAGADLSFQWYYKTSATAAWTKCSEAPANDKVYTLPAAKAAQNGYFYRCEISNASGKVYTPEVKLTVTSVDATPQIQLQPLACVVQAGQMAFFDVAAVGTDLKYQWYYRTPNSGWMKCDAAVSTYDTYTFTTEARHNGYEYRCEVSNLAGTVTSNAATLTVTTNASAPVIATQPMDQTVDVGDYANFYVSAVGNGLKYQWYYRIGGGGAWYKCDAAPSTNDYYSFATQKHQNGYEYRCDVSNAYGTVSTNTVKLTVVAGAAAPVISQHPLDYAAKEGDYATFYVSAVGTGLKFQWYYRISSSGAWMKCDAAPSTNSWYSLKTEARQNGFEYCCEVSNSAGKVTSSVAKLTVVGVPVNVVSNLIKTQPVSTAVTAGSPATFTVVANGSDLSYQWYYRPGGTDYWYTCDAATSTNATYTLTTEKRQNGFEYRCAVKSGSNVEYTQVVKLTVN